MQSVSEAASETQQSAGSVTTASDDVREKASELDTQSKIFIDRIRNADRRKETREEVSAGCSLTINGSSITARMIDISPSGAAIRADGSDVKRGAKAALQIEGFNERLEGEVVGSTMNRISLKFSPRLAAGVVEKMRGARRASKPGEAA